MCLGLKTFWVSWNNFWTKDGSPEITRSSTHAMTMRLTLPEEPVPVKVHGSDLRQPSLWRTCMISVHFWDHQADDWVSRPSALDTESLLELRRIWVPFDSSMGVLGNAEATCETAAGSHLWSWLIIKMILRVVACVACHCMNISCLLVGDLSEVFSNETSLENA